MHNDYDNVVYFNIPIKYDIYNISIKELYLIRIEHLMKDMHILLFQMDYNFVLKTICYWIINQSIKLFINNP